MVQGRLDGLRSTSSQPEFRQPVGRVVEHAQVWADQRERLTTSLRRVEMERGRSREYVSVN